MKQTVNLHDFEQAFRSLRPKSFSYEGLEALFNFLENLEEDTGSEIELDVIAICCDFTEYENIEEYLSEHSTDVDKLDFVENEYAYTEAIKEEIQDKTTLIDIDGESFIIQDF